MNVRTQWRPLLALAVTASLLLAACSSNTGSSASASTSGSSGPMDLNTVPPKPDYSGTIAADGATVPQPVYEQWTQDFDN